MKRQIYNGSRNWMKCLELETPHAFVTIETLESYCAHPTYRPLYFHTFSCMYANHFIGNDPSNNPKLTRLDNFSYTRNVIEGPSTFPC